MGAMGWTAQTKARNEGEADGEKDECGAKVMTHAVT
jgi:hypothetical protein